MIFRGYIDESYGPKQNVFSWSCLIATGKDWAQMERKWKLYLAAKNKELRKSAGRSSLDIMVPIVVAGAGSLTDGPTTSATPSY